jgi:peptide deformylase
MAVLPILEYPDPRLRLRGEPVAHFDASLSRLVDDLCDTLRASKGIGLAAPQVGDRRRVLVIDLSGGAEPPEVYVNPEIHERAVPGLVEESCLSVPGVVGNVVRATQLTASARDRDGTPFERRLEGMRAVCLQHELDHLEGRLFVDRLSLFRRIGLRLGAAARARAASA